MPDGTYRDAWGIPHLRAADVRALARAQGRVTALDRAWQLEVERHRVQGTSAAFLGAGSLGWDLFARRARLADTARRCFDRLERTDPETADWVRAYVEGVNEGLAEGGRRAPEFRRAGLAPGRWEVWHPLGVWLATHILFAGFPAKLWREEAVRHLGADAVGLFATDGPATSGSNGWLVDGSRTVTGKAVIAGDPHRFIEDPGVYQQIHLSCPEFDVVGLAVPGLPGIAHFGHTGDVAWAITNAMADYQDLYRERLRRVDGDAGGDGGGDGCGDKPADEGVHGDGGGGGHGGGGEGAVEALDPDGVWRPVHRHVEVVEVAGGEPVEVEVIETARGPVVVGGPDAGVSDDVRAPGRPRPSDDPRAPDAVGPLSLRCPPRVTGDLGLSALLPLLRARNVADVDRAFDAWAEPVNVVQAADTRGGVLHRVAGRVPLRSRDNRTRVVAAWEPGHEWRGWHAMPYGTVEDGVAVMANQRGPATPLGVEFAPPHRADRIRAMLDEKRVWSAAEMPALHMDTHLASAGPLLDRLAALDGAAHGSPAAGSAAAGLTPAAAALRDRLLRWDRRMEADSVDAAAYATLRGAVVRRLAAEPAFAALAVPPAYPEVFRPWLSLTVRIGFALEHLLRSEELYGIDRDALVRQALEEAAGARAGRWGDSHRLVPWRALPDDGSDGDPDAGSDGGSDAGSDGGSDGGSDAGSDGGSGGGSGGGSDASDGPGLAGDHDCVLCTSAVPGVTDLSARGPAARYVWDLARREDSLWVVPFGASGVGGSAHHRDQLPLWLRGELVPVVTDWDRLTREDGDAPAPGGNRHATGQRGEAR